MTSAKRDNSRGFTVIELMVVTLIIAILMSIAYRMSGIGAESENRNRTVERLQKLENCLSGYYAAYGSYPPVPLQGVSRSIDAPVDKLGVQTRSNAEPSGNRLSERWKNVQAACMAQPVAAKFPFPEAMDKRIKEVSDQVQEMVRDSEGDILQRNFENVDHTKYSGNVSDKGSGDKGSYKNATEWSNVRIFRYGLLSFLLPRYLLMLGGEENLYTDFAQWKNFNNPPANISNGKRFENDFPNKDWEEFKGWIDSKNIFNEYTGKIKRTAANQDALAMLEALPSQSVCRRWIVNLEGIVENGDTYYGVNTGGSSSGGLPPNPYRIKQDHLCESPNGSLYVLNSVTVKDGWGNPIYYYSEPPYQSYQLWSGGKNGRTFPPWISVDSLEDDKDKKTALEWMSDDIKIMSN